MNKRDSGFARSRERARRLIVESIAFMIALTCCGMFAESADETAFVVHTGQHYSLKLIPASRSEAVEICCYNRQNEGRLPTAAELATIVSDSDAPMADRQHALEEIRRRRLTRAAESLLRLAESRVESTTVDLRRLRIEAVVTLFEMADSRAAQAADAALSPDGHDFDGKEGLLDALSQLSDRDSLQVMVKALYSGGRYEEFLAARALGRRSNPEAESALIEKFFRSDTEGDTFGAIEIKLAESGSSAAARALLARGMLNHCTPQDFGADHAAWRAWASGQAPARWVEISKSAVCTMPGSPEEGDAVEGSVTSRWRRLRVSGVYSKVAGEPVEPLRPRFGNHRIVMKALEAPLYPYCFADSRGCFRLREGQGRSWGRHLGFRPYVALDELFSLDFGSQDFQLGPPSKWEWPRSPTRKLAEDEGELIFFVGKEKYYVTFHYQTRAHRPNPRIP
jgi:hypothetical protein